MRLDHRSWYRACRDCFVAEMLETGAADRVVSCPHAHSTDTIWLDSRTRILYQACDDCLTQPQAIEGIREA